MWLMQVFPILRTHDLMGIVNGTELCPQKTITNDQGKEVPNPEFNVWSKNDQYLLSVIIASLIVNVLSIVYGLHTSRQAGITLANKFAS